MALTIGVKLAATSRHSASSENGSRSSSEPPPRAITITSISRVAVERADRVAHLGDGERPLHGYLPHCDAHGRPAAAGVLDHVALGCAGAPGDQPDGVRQERQRPFARCREKSFGGEDGLEPLDARQQLACPDRAYLVGDELQRAAGQMHLGLSPKHHPGALAQTLDHRRAGTRPAGSRQPPDRAG